MNTIDKLDRNPNLVATEDRTAQCTTRKVGVYSAKVTTVIYRDLFFCQFTFRTCQQVEFFLSLKSTLSKHKAPPNSNVWKEYDIIRFERLCFPHIK